MKILMWRYSLRYNNTYSRLYDIILVLLFKSKVGMKYKRITFHFDEKLFQKNIKNEFSKNEYIVGGTSLFLNYRFVI